MVYLSSRKYWKATLPVGWEVRGVGVKVVKEKGRFKSHIIVYYS